MPALDRFDEWEATVDARLAAAEGCAHPAPAIEDLYDDDTLRAIDREAAPVTRPGWRGGLAAGAVAAGLLGAAGVRDDDDEEDAIVELERARGVARVQAVTVHLVWGDPAASVAIVRPWLL